MSSIQNQMTGPKRWLPYRARRPFSPGAYAVYAGGILAILVVSGVFAALTGIAVLGIVAIFSYPSLYRDHAARTTALGVYPRGLVTGGKHVPWSAVAEIALTEPTPDAGTAFAVRVREGWARLAGLDDLRPDAHGFHLHDSTTRDVDLSKLRAALRAWAPADVVLTGF